MERLNLNLPADARKELHRLARQAKLRDAEYARDLLLRALDDAARDELAHRCAETQTPELVARELEIAEAFERLRRG